MEKNKIEQLSNKISINLNYLGLNPEEMLEEGFILTKSHLLKLDHFKKISESKNNINEFLLDLNINKENISKYPKLSTIIDNINDIYQFIYSLKNEYIEVKIKLNQQREDLLDINQKNGFDFLSIDNLEQIQNSFLEENPSIEELIFNLKNLNLSDICRVTNEETIKSKLLKQ